MSAVARRALPLGLLALFVAACGFDPAGGRARGGGDGDGQGDVDGSPGTFDGAPGGADGAPSGTPDADPDVEVLVDTLTIEAAGEEVESEVTLLAGTTYRLVVSGIVTVSTTAGGYSADAEYFWRDSEPNSVFDGQGGEQPVDIGVSIDDPEVDGNKSPDWGAPTANHTYQELVVGDNETITARFHDGNYDNNSGELTLQIYQTAL